MNDKINIKTPIGWVPMMQRDLKGHYLHIAFISNCHDWIISNNPDGKWSLYPTVKDKWEDLSNMMDLSIFKNQELEQLIENFNKYIKDSI